MAFDGFDVTRLPPALIERMRTSASSEIKSAIAVLKGRDINSQLYSIPEVAQGITMQDGIFPTHPVVNAITAYSAGQKSMAATAEELRPALLVLQEAHARLNSSAVPGDDSIVEECKKVSNLMTALNSFVGGADRLRSLEAAPSTATPQTPITEWKR